RSIPRHPAHQSPFSELLARAGSERQPESRLAFFDAQTLTQPQRRSDHQADDLSGTESSSGAHLPLQTAALLSPAEETSHPQAVPTPDPALPPRGPPVAGGRVAATGAARSNAGLLESGD